MSRHPYETGRCWRGSRPSGVALPRARIMKRVKIGVVGCGAIAQVHHLPNLTALHEQFEVAVVCDVSPRAAADAASRFPRASPCHRLA